MQARSSCEPVAFEDSERNAAIWVTGLGTEEMSRPRQISDCKPGKELVDRGLREVGLHLWSWLRSRLRRRWLGLLTIPVLLLLTLQAGYWRLPVEGRQDRLA